MTDAIRIPRSVGSAASYVAKRWGGPTRLVPSGAVFVPQGVTRIVKNNPRRMAMTVANTGSINAYAGWDSSVSITSGILLPPLGGILEMDVDEDGELVTYDMWLAIGVGGTTISVFEVETI